jgi:epoxyqueuosine reductase
MESLATLLDHYAREQLQFLRVGIMPVAPALHFAAFGDWLDAGLHGEMDWLESAGRKAKRRDIRAVLPSAKTIITLAYTYNTHDLPEEVLHDPARGIFARYTWGRDYHKVLKKKLQQLINFIETTVGHKIEAKAYVDTGPILERDLAQRAGLGFIGRHSQLINSQYGSYLFLCEIIMNEPCDLLTSAAKGSCRNCQACVQACPTKAIIRDRTIDARKCISYLTIEVRGSIPENLRPLLGNRVYGCDICQEVCPWNGTSAARLTRNDWLEAALLRQAPPLLELAQLSEADFLLRFQGTPIMRAKRRGLLRNVAVALGNWGSVSAYRALEQLATEPDALIADHARFSLRFIEQTR